MRPDPYASVSHTKGSGENLHTSGLPVGDSAAISQERVAEWVAGAEKVLADDLPAGHKLWKSWALDLADQVLALAYWRHQQ